jgi:hypothetical protein
MCTMILSCGEEFDSTRVQLPWVQYNGFQLQWGGTVIKSNVNLMIVEAEGALCSISPGLSSPLPSQRVMDIGRKPEPDVIPRYLGFRH